MGALNKTVGVTVVGTPSAASTGVAERRVGFVRVAPVPVVKVITRGLVIWTPARLFTP